MKTFVAVIVVCLGIQLGFSSSVGGEPVLTTYTGEVDPQSIADFWQRVVEYYQKLKTYTKDFVCSAKLQELLDVLGVPDDLDGAVKMAQNYFCGGDDIPQKRSVSSGEADLQSIADFWQRVVEYYRKLKTYTKDFVCSAKLQELLDVLGVPDDLDGAVKMAQNYFCGGDDIPQKRSASNGEVDLQSIADFWQRVVEYYQKLKTYTKDFVCSAKLQELLDVLGVPDDLDGAVKMAQNYFCGGDDIPQKRSVSSGEADLQSIADFWQRVVEYYRKLKAYTKDFVCSAKLKELLDVLGVPDDLDGTVKMAQKYFCGGDDMPERKSVSMHYTTKMELIAMQAFPDIVKDVYEKLKKYLKSFVCSANLHALLDLLGLPDQYDGVVDIARKLLCGDAISARTTGLRDQEGLFDTIQEIKMKLDVLGWDKACKWSISQLMEHLGYPSSYKWAFTIVQGFYC